MEGVTNEWHVKEGVKCVVFQKLKNYNCIEHGTVHQRLNVAKLINK